MPKNYQQDFGSVITSKTSFIDEIINLARKSSIFYLLFGLACCGIELMQTGGPRADIDRFGSVPRGTGIESGAEVEDAAEVGVSSRITVGSASGGGGYGRHSGMAYTFSQEAVREFRVSGQNYSALYGHAAGGIVTTVSKSGTNHLHGTGFYLLRASALGASLPTLEPLDSATPHSASLS